MNLSTPPGSDADKHTWREWLRGRGGTTDRATAAELLRATAATESAVRAALRPGVAVGSFVATAQEPPTGALHQWLRGQGIEVYVPWAHPDRSMGWLPDLDGSAQPWGVPGIGPPPFPGLSVTSAQLRSMPLAVVFIPAVGLAGDGARLGYGGGYYDRFLAATPPHSQGGPVRVGVTWADCIVAALPTDLHDQTVDIVLGV